MRTRYIHVSDRVYDTIEELSDYIISQTTRDHARQYTQQILSEIRELSYLADAIPVSRYEMAKKYSPNAKILITKNKKWSIIFHTDDYFVYIEEMLPSSMITH